MLMIGSSHHVGSVARAVERSLDTECDLLVETEDGRGGQTMETDHSGVACSLSMMNDREDRRARRSANQSLYVLLFTKDVPVREHHEIHLTDRFGEERTFAVQAIAPVTEEDTHLTVHAQETSE